MSQKAHAQNITYNGPIEDVIDSFKQLLLKNSPIALWLGASQLHAINDLRVGDQLAVQYANDFAKQRGSNLIYLQHSFPNAGLNDMLLMYLLFRQDHLAPKWLIIAVTYDDLIEDKFIEKHYTLIHTIDPKLQTISPKAFVDIDTKWQMFQKQQNDDQAIKRNTTSGTPQEQLEQLLIKIVEKILPGYTYRGELLAKINVMIRTSVRNIVKGRLKQLEVRKIPKLPKDKNTITLEAIVKLAQQDGTKVLFYKAPHRPTKRKFYHDRETYDHYFKSYLKNIKDGKMHIF